MMIEKYGQIDRDLQDWNDRMYADHPTPYSGIAGIIERARVRAILKTARISPNNAVLEIGCERGTLLAALPSCHRLVGADISTAALKDAERLFADSAREAEFIQVDAQQPLPFERGEFDLVVCSEMLEHVPDPRAVMRNIHDIADEHTRVVVSVPIEGPKIFVKKLLKATGLMKLLFKDIEDKQSEWHLHAFSRRQLLEMVEDLFEVEKQRRVWGIHYVVSLRRKQPTAAI